MGKKKKNQLIKKGLMFFTMSIFFLNLSFGSNWAHQGKFKCYELREHVHNLEWMSSANNEWFSQNFCKNGMDEPNNYNLQLVPDTDGDGNISFEFQDHYSAKENVGRLIEAINIIDQRASKVDDMLENFKGVYQGLLTASSLLPQVKAGKAAKVFSDNAKALFKKGVKDTAQQEFNSAADVAAGDIQSQREDINTKLLYKLAGGLINSNNLSDMISNLSCEGKSTDDCTSHVSVILGNLRDEISTQFENEATKASFNHIFNNLFQEGSIQELARRYGKNAQEIQNLKNILKQQVPDKDEDEEEVRKTAEENREAIGKLNDDYVKLEESHEKMAQEMEEAAQALGEFSESVTQMFETVHKSINHLEDELKSVTTTVEDNKEKIGDLEKGQEAIKKLLYGKLSTDEKVWALETDFIKLPTRADCDASEKYDPSGDSYKGQAKCSCNEKCVKERALGALKFVKEKEKIVAMQTKFNNGMKYYSAISNIAAGLSFVTPEEAQKLQKFGSLVSTGVNTIMNLGKGDWLGALEQLGGLIGLFGSPQPDPTHEKLDAILANQETILNQIGVIRQTQVRILKGQRQIMQSIADLRVQIKEGFDEIHIHLNEIESKIEMNRVLLGTISDSIDGVSKCRNFVDQYETHKPDDTTYNFSIYKKGVLNDNEYTEEGLYDFVSSGDNPEKLGFCLGIFEDLYPTQISSESAPSNRAIRLIKHKGADPETAELEINRIYRPHNKLLNLVIEHSNDRVFSSSDNSNTGEVSSSELEIRQKIAYFLLKSRIKNIEDIDLKLSSSREKILSIFAEIGRSQIYKNYISNQTFDDIQYDLYLEKGSHARDFYYFSPIEYTSFRERIEWFLTLNPIINFIDNRDTCEGELIPPFCRHKEKISLINPEGILYNRRDLTKEHFVVAISQLNDYALANEAMLAGDLVIPRLYKSLIENTNWNTQPFNSSANISQPRIMDAIKKAMNEERGNKQAKKRAICDPDHEDNIIMASSFDGVPPTRRFQTPDYKIIILGVCLLQKNPLFAKNFAKYLVKKEFSNQSGESLINYKIATSHSSNDLLSTFANNSSKWKFVSKIINQDGEKYTYWFIQFGHCKENDQNSCLLIKMPDAEELTFDSSMKYSYIHDILSNYRRELQPSLKELMLNIRMSNREYMATQLGYKNESGEPLCINGCTKEMRLLKSSRLLYAMEKAHQRNYYSLLDQTCTENFRGICQSDNDDSQTEGYDLNKCDICTKQFWNLETNQNTE